MLAVRSPSSDSEKTLILGGGPDAGAGPCPDELNESQCDTAEALVDPQEDEVIVVDSFGDDDDAPLHGVPGRNIGQVKREAILPATQLPSAKFIASSGGTGKTRVPVNSFAYSQDTIFAAHAQKMTSAKAVPKVSGRLDE